MSDGIRELIEHQETMRRLTDPLRDIGASLKSATNLYDQAGLGAGIFRLIEADEERRKLLSSLYEGSVVGTMMRDMEQHRKLIEGPLDQARRLGLLDPGSDMRSSLAVISAEHDRYKQLFQLPASSDIGRLAREAIGAQTLAQSVLTATGRLDGVEAAMRTMKSPWLNIDHELRSARAFGDLLGIGRGVTVLAPFEAALVESLRPGLGDWRDPMVALDAWKDPTLRSGFYLERGFDPALTDFTRMAFTETVEVAGLAPSPSVTSDDDTDGLTRSREAFARLQNLECAIRRFIVRVMEAAFGAMWMERQLPTGMLDGWIAKRDKAMNDGQPAEPLINYADFTDYKAIIERRDNWSSVFKPVFGRPEDIRESFQRMFPLRIATMHARLITSDDELLLMVETRRILRAIEH